MAASAEVLVAHQPAPSIFHAKRLFDQGHTDAAGEMARRVLQAQPANVDAMILLAVLAKARGDHAEIDRLMQTALAVRPKNRFLLTVWVENLFQSGDARRAIEESDRALASFPEAPEFIMVKALAHEVRLEFAQAFDALQPLLQAGQPTADALTLAGRILDGLDRPEEAIALTKPVAEDGRLAPDKRQRVWFQLVKAYDRLGQHEQAMDAAARAHALSSGRFDAAAFERTVDDLMTAFSANSLRSLARSSIASDLPVFIIGMPRSGTTLVEQIIHAHPQCFGAGEMLGIESVAKALPIMTGSLYPYPHAVVDVTKEIANRFAAEYLQRLRQYDAAALRIADKMLEQYLHVGLIWMLLPGARVIHVRRDPLDTCLSCYTRHLNPHRMTYARSLEHLGFVYRQHERLMAHWKQTLDLPILTVQYEELVADQERVSRQIIDFLGLAWNDSCLRYWQSDRTVMTLSYDQVNRPIFDSSIGRWRQYEKHLGPLKAALEASVRPEAAHG